MPNPCIQQEECLFFLVNILTEMPKISWIRVFLLTFEHEIAIMRVESYDPAGAGT